MKNYSNSILEYKESLETIYDKYYKDIDLPTEVNIKNFSKNFNNSVLEIKLKKAKLLQ